MEMIVVLGGGAVEVDVDSDGGRGVSVVPPKYVRDRCVKAAELRLERLADGAERVMILLLSAGTAHVPQPIGVNGLPVWESTGSAAWLMGLGRDGGIGPGNSVPASDLLLETTSYDTVGNAWFARLQHVDVLNPTTLWIITSEFHMSRTQAIFDFVMSLGRAAARGEGDPKPPVLLKYVSTPDSGLDEADVRARAQREARSEETFRRGVMEQCKCLEDFHTFMHHAHAMYSAQGLTRNATVPANPDPTILRSYGGGRADNRG